MSKNQNKRITADEPQQVTDAEEKILVDLMTSCLPLDGDIVEFGCYRGDTSVLFERALEKWRKANGIIDTPSADNPNPVYKKLWIYDSFAGLPEKTIEDSSVAGDQFKAGELLVTKREVVEKFKRSGLRLPVIRKGFFEDLDPTLDVPRAICFGFLDGDLYASIKTSLRLTASRIANGGILAVHDYMNPELPGVSRAVDEWFAAARRSGRKVSLSRRESLAILTFAW